MNKLTIDCVTGVESTTPLTDQEVAAVAVIATGGILDRAKFQVGGDLDALYAALPLANRTDATWGYGYRSSIKSAFSTGDYAAAQAMVTALPVPPESQGAKDALLTKFQVILG